MGGGVRRSRGCGEGPRQFHSVGGGGGGIQAVSLCGRGWGGDPRGRSREGGGGSLCRTCSPRITSSD